MRCSENAYDIDGRAVKNRFVITRNSYRTIIIFPPLTPPPSYRELVASIYVFYLFSGKNLFSAQYDFQLLQPLSCIYNIITNSYDETDCDVAIGRSERIHFGARSKP